MTQPVVVTTNAGGTPPAQRLHAGGIILAIALLTALALFNGVRSHENRYEKLADAITRAIVNNDMRPVEQDFNALRRPQLEDHAKVGALSDFVAAEGTFMRTHEDTANVPHATPSGLDYHHFVAEFSKGDLSEDVTLDADGKVADFHVRSAAR